MPRSTARVMFLVLVVGLSGALLGCGDSGSEAQRRDVGSACMVDTDCTETGQVCLTFKGGYCVTFVDANLNVKACVPPSA